MIHKKRTERTFNGENRYRIKQERHKQPIHFNSNLSYEKNLFKKLSGIAPDRNDISLANIESLVESLTHACASLRSFKHGYLSLQKYSLQQYFIKKLPLPTLLHNRRFYPQSTS